MSFATDEPTKLFWERPEDDLVEQLAAASERVFDAKLMPDAVRQRLLPSVRQSRGGVWTLRAKLPAHARFWNVAGTVSGKSWSIACACRLGLIPQSAYVSVYLSLPHNHSTQLYLYL